MTPVLERVRKSNFVRRFDKTPSEVRCPHFYELILSNGCPYDCAYCYLKLTFRGKTSPTLFTNEWTEVLSELKQSGPGVYNTGELADSLAVCPPLLESALDYFSNCCSKYLLLVTKSDNISLLQDREPSTQVIVSFSVNSDQAAKVYEKGAPSPRQRLRAACALKKQGWRVRVRIDPVIPHTGLDGYRGLCEQVAELGPERVTVGTLRQYPGVHNFSKTAPRRGLQLSPDGRLRYPEQVRIDTYQQFSDWLGFKPALCKETYILWRKLGWRFMGCNCTP